MPFGDRTGPTGRGPMTGRGMGYCAGYDAPGYASHGPGFGRGPGRGMGFGRGRWFWHRQAPPARFPDPGYGYQARPVTPTKEQQAKMLEAEKGELEAELSEIQEEIKQISRNIAELRKK